MRNIELKYAIVKINLIMFMILAFGLYDHFIIASTMIAIAGLDIILSMSGLQIAGRKKAKFILLLLLHGVIISAAIIIGAERSYSRRNINYGISENYERIGRCQK